jgi:hypothetical protein
MAKGSPGQTASSSHMEERDACFACFLGLCNRRDVIWSFWIEYRLVDHTWKHDSSLQILVMLIKSFKDCVLPLWGMVAPWEVLINFDIES